MIVNGDAARLQQVVWNLLSNAVKFTPRGGKVAVSVTLDSSSAILKVSDTGHGIPADCLPRLFERFWQADGSITRRFGGLGLGLAIVRHIMELHGGSVSAASAGLDKGAEFTVTMPAEVNAKLPRDKRLSSGALPAGRSHRARRRRRCRYPRVDRQFWKPRAKVPPPHSVTEALSLIERLNPDVLLSDIGMPDEDGYSLIRKVRAQESSRGRRLPSAALTAFAKTEDRDAALSAGFDDHVSKPLEPENLPFLVAQLARKTTAPARTADRLL